jgi:hypothetical protein
MTADLDKGARSAILLTRNQRQESLSRAYVQAVVARAGMSVSVPTPDAGIDLSVHDIIEVGRQRIESGYRIDIQAKSTSIAHLDTAQVRYDLEVPSYESLRYPAGNPRILIVLVLPEDEAEWLSQTEQELTLRRAAYWLSLRGAPETRNRRSVRVSIPRGNVFSAEALQAMMARIKSGAMP